MVEEERASLPVSRACELVGIGRSGLYEARHPRPDRDGQLRKTVERIVVKWPGYGYRRVRHELIPRGFAVNHKRVLRVMRDNGWLCRVRRSRVRTTQSDHGLGVFPNLARGLEVTGLDQLWVADLTYIRLPRGFVYLATILDAHSRRVLGWQLAPYLDTRLTLGALGRALALRPDARGVVLHSDQGVQYASEDYVARAAAAGLVQSMSRRDQPLDNALAESFFATLKMEEIRLNEYRDIEEARARISWFIDDIYNRKRLHSALGYRAPVQFEAAAAQSISDGAAAAASNAITDQALFGVPPNGITTPALRGHYETPVTPNFSLTTVR